MNVKTFGSYEQANPVIFTDEIDFAGRTWKPNLTLAYMVLTVAHSWPARNKNGHAITAATMANSVDTALNQLVDFEHNHKRLCGAIAAVEFPEKSVAVAAAEAGTGQALRALVAVHRRAAGSQELLEDVVKNAASWQASLEWDFRITDSWVWDGQRAMPWESVPASIRDGAVKDGAVSAFKLPLTLLSGGLDGFVTLTGLAFTRTPADAATEILRLAANDQSAELEIRLWRESNGSLDRMNRARREEGLPATTMTEFTWKHHRAIAAASRARDAALPSERARKA